MVHVRDAVRRCLRAQIESGDESDLAATRAQLSHVPQMGLWVVRAGYSIKFSVANTTEHGTDRRSATELLEDALNLRTPTVYDHDARSEKDVVNVPATEAARDKQEKIKERFKSWIWQDDERRERLARKYNDEFNNVRLRSFNGDHLTLPGASPAIELRSHRHKEYGRQFQQWRCYDALNSWQLSGGLGKRLKRRLARVFQPDPDVLSFSTVAIIFGSNVALENAANDPRGRTR